MTFTTTTTTGLLLLLLGAAALTEAVPMVAPQKYGRPPVASPTAVENRVYGKRFDENGNEIKLSPHQLETRRRSLVEHQEGTLEFEAALNPVVNTIAWDGVEGYTTYQLSLDLATRSDAYNVYSIHGTQDSPLTLPPAFQVAEPFGSVYGGVNPIMFAYSPEAQYDSWLTLGVTTGKEAFTGESLSMIGLDLDSWSETQGVHCDNGAMFFMDPAHGPTLEDRDGPLGPREDRGEIVVAQLTVPNEGSYTVTMNAQGRIKDWAEAEEGAIVNWNEEGITFTFGDVEQAGTHTEAPPPPPAPGMIEYETAAVTPIVQTISSDAIEGHTTFRLALRLEGDAYDVYSIYGQEGHPMTIPPAFQNGGTFGVNVGGVNPAFFALDMPGAAGGEFDSWLTVGLTEGAGDELSNIGIQWPSWTDSTGLQVTDGSVFWMTPQDGPTMTDRDGKAGAATEGGDIVVAQLTVKNDQTYTAVINAQGHTQPRPDGRSGESWNEMDIEFTFGTITAAIGPCTLRATAAVNRHGLDGEYVPQCDASGGSP